MGVVTEYFVRHDDEQAASLLESFTQDDGVIAMEPATELVVLEAFLLGIDPDGSAGLELLRRPDHARVVAHDGEPYDAYVSRIADHTAALIANATPEQLGAAMQPWSQIPEFGGGVSAAELTEVMGLLQPLFQRAIAEGRHVYSRTTC